MLPSRLNGTVLITLGSYVGAGTEEIDCWGSGWLVGAEGVSLG